MKLGYRVQIAIGVADLAESLEFYRRLGFVEVAANGEPYPWAQITDGQNLILLNQDGMSYRGLIYFSDDVAARVRHIEDAGIPFIHKTEHNGQVVQAILFNDAQQFGVNLLAHDASDLYQPTGEPVTRCGKFGEFAIPVANIKDAYDFWRTLGFAKLGGNFDPTTGGSDGSWGPYTWAIISDGLIVLGLHETTDFPEPTLTYFAGNQAETLAQLKDENFPFTFSSPDENGVVANAGLAAPDGQKLFLFQGEI